MTPLICGLLSVALFVYLLVLFQLVEKSREIFVISRKATQVLTSSQLSEDVKEKAMRTAAIQLASLFVVITSGVAVSIITPWAILWLIDRFGFTSLAAVLDELKSTRMILIGSVFSVIAIVFRNRLVHVARK
jgi:hypothetical protein